ncbi:putative Ig domain-containing protein [Ramlibacter montanisoli]|uniref:putative Ig domain-containing protein n=1 Tax=Ramlibacter montanisoli TaxID=2732512 RepID=UPI00209C4AF6|nr:putative Ig domain-containing protein [Ramlibacter montanisoli]
MLSWTPGFDQAGSHSVTVTATDDGDGTGTPLSTVAVIPLRVRNANRVPAIVAIDNQVVTKGEVLEIPIAVTDADGNALDLRFEVTLKGLDQPVAFDGLPLRADGRAPLFDFRATGNGTGVLRVAPGERDRGDYLVTLVARDDGDGEGEKGRLRETRTFVVKVDSAGETPVLAPIGDKVALIGQALNFTVSAGDLDEDALTLTADALPAGATLLPGAVYGTADFSWTPGSAGVHEITFTVTDSLGQSDSRTIQLEARAANAAPILPRWGTAWRPRARRWSSRWRPATATATRSATPSPTCRPVPASTRRPGA